MAKTSIFLASALCVLTFIGSAYGVEKYYNIEGQVYCDTCRLGFITPYSTYMSDAEVQVECWREGREVTFKKVAKTDSKGSYSVKVETGKEEICQVKLVKSSIEDCSEKDDRFAIVNLTNDDDISPYDLAVGPLGFLANKIRPECKEIIGNVKAKVVQ